MKISITLLISFLFVNCLNGQTFDLKKGWQMKGAYEEITSLDGFNNKCVDYIWTYDSNSTNDWKVHVANGDDVTIDNNKILTSISKDEGFWIKANTDDCYIDTDVIESGQNNDTLLTEYTPPQVDFGSDDYWVSTQDYLDTLVISSQVTEYYETYIPFYKELLQGTWISSCYYENGKWLKSALNFNGSNFKQTTATFEGYNCQQGYYANSLKTFDYVSFVVSPFQYGLNFSKDFPIALLSFEMTTGDNVTTYGKIEFNSQNMITHKPGYATSTKLGYASYSSNIVSWTKYNQ